MNLILQNIKVNINVGTRNATKLQAVIDTFILYPKLFPDPEIVGVDVDIEIYGHPINFEQIIHGAKDRAKQAFYKCEYSVGIESGLVSIKDVNTGYMEISSSVLFDGTNFYYGLSSGFEWPQSVTKGIIEGKGDASKLFKDLNLSQSEKQGSEQGGIIGLLTKGRLGREDQIKQSLITALIYLENPILKA